MLLTEQEYRALRHPPFVRLVRQDAGAVGDFPPKGERGWMADRVYDWDASGVALIRRIARADWPAPFDESRSEIARVRVEEAFR